MTLRILIAHCLLLMVATLSACNQPTAQPKQAKAAKVEAKFIPENPNFPEGATSEAETPKQAESRDWWNSLKGEDGPPIEAATYSKTAILNLPFEVDQPTVEAALPAGWTLLNDKAPPIYDPTLLTFSDTRYSLPDATSGATPATVVEATLGFHNGKFGDLRLLFKALPDSGRLHAQFLLETYGPTIIDKMQEPDPVAKIHRKMITLTWRVVDEGKRNGFISYQVTFEGPTAGDADHFLVAGDRFVQASFTTMSPDMMTALRAANPVGSGTTP